MSAAPADVTGALAAYLLSELGDLVDDRVFRPELPSSEDHDMPQARIVIRAAGGYSLFSGGYVPLGDPRLDVFCFGDTWHRAEMIAASVIVALRALKTSTWQSAGVNTRLNWARITAGPTPFADPSTQWPCSVVTAQVAHCELAVA